MTLKDAKSENKGTTHAADKPWIFRTYAGHSTAKASNELYRTNLSRGGKVRSLSFSEFQLSALNVNLMIVTYP